MDNISTAYKTAQAVAAGAIGTEPKKAAKAAAARKRHIRRYALTALFLATLAGGWVNPLLGYFIPLCMVMGLGMAVKDGRKWCGTWCPRGAFYDAAVKPLSPGKRIPGVFKRLPLRAGMLSFLMFMMTWQIIARWPDPHAIGAFFVTLLTVTTVAGILLAMKYQQRTWCYICPIGTMSKWIGGVKKPVTINGASCKDCGLCAKACPVQIKPNEHRFQGTVSDADCVKCSSCVAVCPKNALKLS